VGDIKCARCGEKWDSHGVREGDMEPDESRRFLRGEGCPGCGFGSQCPACNGTGHAEVIYRAPSCCYGKGYTMAWSPQRSSGRFKAGEFYVGYEPSVRHIEGESLKALDPVTFGVRSFPEKIRTFMSADGAVDEWWVTCPEGCGTEKGPITLFDPCTSCDGSGKLKVDEDAALEAARSHLEESDEEPIGLLIERGLL
jgi:RecJ-like exonuclease